MARVAHRAYTRKPRTSSFLLLSLLLHLLMVVALSLPLRPWGALRPEPKEQHPILVSLVRPENTEEPERPEVFAETSSRAHTPEAPKEKEEVAKASQTILPKAEQAPAESSPPSKPQASEEAPPQMARPPIRVTPKPAPEVTTKRPSSSSRRQESAKAAPPKPEAPPAEQPEPKRLAKLPEPAEGTPPRLSQKRTPAEQPEPKRLAKLPEPAEPPSPHLSQEYIPSTRPFVDSPPQSGQTALPRFGRDRKSVV